MKNTTLFTTACCLLSALFIYFGTGCDPLANCGDNDPAAELNPRCGFDEAYALEAGKKYAGQGQIVGAEYTACMCCGGYWLVTTEADSVLFGYVPENIDFTFGPNEQFPIPVEYEFFTDSAICWQVTRYVTLLSLKRI